MIPMYSREREKLGPCDAVLLLISCAQVDACLVEREVGVRENSYTYSQEIAFFRIATHIFSLADKER